MVTGGTDRSGYRNVGWRNRGDWRAEFLLEEQGGVEIGMSPEGSERIVELNVV